MRFFIYFLLQVCLAVRPEDFIYLSLQAIADQDEDEDDDIPQFLQDEGYGYEDIFEDEYLPPVHKLKKASGHKIKKIKKKAKKTKKKAVKKAKKVKKKVLKAKKKVMKAIGHKAKKKAKKILKK